MNWEKELPFKMEESTDVKNTFPQVSNVSSDGFF